MAPLLVWLRRRRLRHRPRGVPALELVLRRRALKTAAAGLAFAAVTLLVAVGVIDAPDRAIVDFAQRAASGPLDVLASVVSLGGRAEVTLAATLALSVATARRRGVRGLFPLLLLLTLVAVEVGLKNVVPQEPPPAELARSVEIIPSARLATPFAYPSGHMARASFLAGLVWPAAGRWRLALGLAVALMAITRVYLAEHWPSDVVGGALLGFAFAWLAVLPIDRRRPHTPRA